MTKPALILALALLLSWGCSRQAITVGGLIGGDDVDVRYLTSDGSWVPADSLGWTDRSCYRELRFDSDGDGEWNYLYGEVFDDVGGWVWVPSSARVNPDEEPELARKKKYLVNPRSEFPTQGGTDDFGYDRR